MRPSIMNLGDRFELLLARRVPNMCLHFLPVRLNGPLSKFNSNCASSMLLRHSIADVPVD